MSATILKRLITDLRQDRVPVALSDIVDTVMGASMKRLMLLLVLALVLRVGFLLVFEGEVNDGTGRIREAELWLQGSHLVFATKPWPMMNYLYPALAIRIGGDSFWSVRILHLATSVCSVWLLYLLVRDLL